MKTQLVQQTFTECFLYILHCSKPSPNPLTNQSNPTSEIPEWCLAWAEGSWGRLREAQLHDPGYAIGGWERLDLNLGCPTPVLLTMTWSGLCDQLTQKLDVKVKGEIRAESEQRPGLRLSFSKTLTCPSFWQGRRSGCFPALFVRPGATD